MENQLTDGDSFFICLSGVGRLLLLWFRVNWGADLFPIRNDPTHFTAIKPYSRLSLFIPCGIKMPPSMTSAEIPANQPIVIIPTFVPSDKQLFVKWTVFWEKRQIDTCKDTKACWHDAAFEI